MYCTYLTFYCGNKMPPFYIGSSSISQIEKGYHGSVSSRRYESIWLSELKNAPQLFKTRVIKTFNTREAAFEHELYLQRKFDVVKSEFYINQSYATKDGFCGRDVSGENNPRFGVPVSLETRAKMSKARNSWSMTEEHCTNISLGGKKLWENHEYRKKMCSMRKGSGNSNFGKYGVDSPNYGKKRTQESKDKISSALKGKKKTEEQCNIGKKVYTIEAENGIIFSGYNLEEFSEAIGLKHTTFFYTKVSKKFKNGFKIIGTADIRGTDKSVPLTLFLHQA